MFCGKRLFDDHQKKTFNGTEGEKNGEIEKGSDTGTEIVFLYLRGRRSETLAYVILTFVYLQKESCNLY